MMEFSEWKLEEVQDGAQMTLVFNNKRLNVLKTFEFASEFQRMSVIVNEKDKYWVFTKGAPEKVKSMCLDESVPHGFTDLLEKNALQGFRVLALAYKEIDRSQANMPRKEAESELNFAGLLILENRLKPDTKHFISRLNAASLAIKIISGDNALTTIQTARESDILYQKSLVLLLDHPNEIEGGLSLKLIKPLENDGETLDKGGSIDSPYDDSISRFNKKSKVGMEMQMLAKEKNFTLQAFNNEKDLLEYYAEQLSKNQLEFAITGSALKELRRRESSFIRNEILPMYRRHSSQLN